MKTAALISDEKPEEKNQSAMSVHHPAMVVDLYPSTETKKDADERTPTFVRRPDPESLFGGFY